MLQPSPRAHWRLSGKHGTKNWYDPVYQSAAKDVKEVESLRIPFGRTSHARGLGSEFPSDDSSLYTRESDREVAPKEPNERKKKEPVSIY